VDPFGRMHTHYYQLTTMVEFYYVFGLITAVTGVLLIFLCLPTENPVFHSGVWCALPAVMYIIFIYLFGFMSTSVFNYINEAHHGEIYIIDRSTTGSPFTNDSNDTIDTVDSTIGAIESTHVAPLLINPNPNHAPRKQTIHDLSRLCSVALQGGALCGTLISFSVFLYVSS